MVSGRLLAVKSFEVQTKSDLRLRQLCDHGARTLNKNVAHILWRCSKWNLTSLLDKHAPLSYTIFFRKDKFRLISVYLCELCITQYSRIFGKSWSISNIAAVRTIWVESRQRPINGEEFTRKRQGVTIVNIRIYLLRSDKISMWKGVKRSATIKVADDATSLPAVYLLGKPEPV